MKNYVQRGDTLSLTAPATLLSGDVVVVGAFIGIAAHDAASGDNVETSLNGVFTLAKAAVAISQGDTLYWVAGSSHVSKTASGNTLIGKATQAAASGDATITVLIG